MTADLFTFRRTDPVTSREAGQAADHFRRGDQIEILGALHRAGKPLAAEEISDALNWNDHVRVNRRLPELVFGLEIERTTELHRNRSGRSAFRYRLSPGKTSTSPPPS